MSAHAVAVAGLASVSLSTQRVDRVMAVALDPALDAGAPAADLLQLRAPILSVSNASGRCQVAPATLREVSRAARASSVIRKVRRFAELVTDELELPALVYRVDPGPSSLWGLDVAQALAKRERDLAAGDRLLTARASFDAIDWSASLDVFLRAFGDGLGVPPLQLCTKLDLAVVRVQAISRQVDSSIQPARIGEP